MRSVPGRVDLGIVGGGPLGAAACRHAAQQGASVALVAGPDAGPGSWFDESRVAHLGDLVETDAVIASRSLASIRRLTAGSESNDVSGVFTPSPIFSICPIDYRPGRDFAGTHEHFDLDEIERRAEAHGVRATRISPSELRRRLPGISFTSDHHAVEQTGLGHINPRKLVRLQREEAEGLGARIVHSWAVGLESTKGGARITAEDGSVIDAQRVILAPGATGSLQALHPSMPAVDCFGAIVILAELAESDPDPVTVPLMMMWEDDHTRFRGVVFPSMRYPNGRRYLKFSGGDVRSVPLRSAVEARRWALGAATEDVSQQDREQIRRMFPGTRPRSFASSRCLVGFTRELPGHMKRLDDRTLALIEGVHGVTLSDELGRLAVEMSLDAA